MEQQGDGDPHRALIRAQGTVLALLAMLLDRRKIVEAVEFGELLGLFAALADKNRGPDGDILAIWAVMVNDAAAGLAEPAEM